jgi:hypothetical protein
MKMSLSAKTKDALSSGELVFSGGRSGTPALLLPIKLGS